MFSPNADTDGCWKAPHSGLKAYRVRVERHPLATSSLHALDGLFADPPDLRSPRFASGGRHGFEVQVIALDTLGPRHALCRQTRHRECQLLQELQ